MLCQLSYSREEGFGNSQARFDGRVDFVCRRKRCFVAAALLLGVTGEHDRGGRLAAVVLGGGPAAHDLVEVQVLLLAVAREDLANGAQVAVVRFDQAFAGGHFEGASQAELDVGCFACVDRGAE